MCILNLTEPQQSKPRGGRKDHQERKRERKLFYYLCFCPSCAEGMHGRATVRKKKGQGRARVERKRKKGSRQKQGERNKAVWHSGEKETEAKQNSGEKARKKGEGIAREGQEVTGKNHRENHSTVCKGKIKRA